MMAILALEVGIVNSSGNQKDMCELVLSLKIGRLTINELVSQ